MTNLFHWMRLPRLGSVALLMALALPLGGTRTVPSGIPGLPRLVLWAWERPEHLESINPHTTAVAFLSRSIFLHGNDVSVRPRMQPLFIAPDTLLISVVRIETRPGVRLSDQQRARTIELLAAAAREPHVIALQVDFDAAASEREFYASLLHDLRARVTVPISITALASWCMGDNWLSSLPVDEAVPMLFRLGRGERESEMFLERHGTSAQLCSESVGVSTDEPRWHLTPGKRVYVFHPHAWTVADVTNVEKQLKSHQ